MAPARASKARSSSRRKAGNQREDAYEQKRLKRIAENQQVLANLGVTLNTSVTSTKPKRVKRTAVRKRKVVKVAPKVASRQSRRRKGLAPEVEGIDELPIVEKSEVESGQQEKEDDSALLAKWSTHLKETKSKSGGEGRRLFLVPTGIPGVNDHTLEKKVESLDSFLWGFCEGLFSRVFQRVRPGDIFLFTSSGCGMFNKVAEVIETRVVTKAVADTFWSRMKFSMGE